MAEIFPKAGAGRRPGHRGLGLADLVAEPEERANLVREVCQLQKTEGS